MTYELVELRETCQACPTQWEGRTACGQDFYLRFRHGYLYIELDRKIVFETVVDDKDGVIELSNAPTLSRIFSISPTCKYSSVYDD